MPADANVILIYRCFTCNEKRIFFPSENVGVNPENDKSVLEYIEYDKKHRPHSGFVLIQKLPEKTIAEKSLTIGKIIQEISSYKE